MLLIPTIVRDSEIHGLGVFCSEDIKKDQLVWRFDPRCDFRMSIFPDWLKKFVFKDSEGAALDGDNARFMNHSENANLYASARDLKARSFIPSGSELTVDYQSPESICHLI